MTTGWRMAGRLVLAATLWLGGTAQAAADPLVHTYSIVARDPVTGDMGVAVQSHWFSVGSIVTWGEAGVGVVATQSFVDPGYGVRGLDIAVDRVARISRGQSPIGDITDARLGPLVSAGRLSASDDDGVLAACDVIFVCVPTPFDANKTPDLRAVIAR